VVVGAMGGVAVVVRGTVVVAGGAGAAAVGARGASQDLTQFARHGADAFGYRANLRINRKLAQLLRLRVSQINNCTYCLNLHYQAARDAGIPDR